jgi:hypothetical protein
MSIDKIGDVECPECEGSGNGGTGMECCGNVTSGGECRGDCVIPIQLPCAFCDGRGSIPASAMELPI